MKLRRYYLNADMRYEEATMYYNKYLKRTLKVPKSNILVLKVKLDNPTLRKSCKEIVNVKVETITDKAIIINIVR